MALSTGESPFSRPRRSLRLTYLLRPPPPPDGGSAAVRHHSAPVNAVACSPGDARWLCTAGRDGSILTWRTSAAAATAGSAPGGQGAPWVASCASVCEGHADWVTSLAVITPAPGYDATQLPGDATFSSAASPLLVSGSFDATVKLWRPVSSAAERASRRPGASPASGTLVATLRGGHSDYVTCVATAPGAACCASAGCGGQLCLWDVATACSGSPGSPLQSIPDVETRTRVMGPAAGASSGGGGGDPGTWSIYALAMAPASSPGAPLLAWGDASGAIRLWDTRTAPPPCWSPPLLSGHTDTVRQLLLDPPGHRCVSAGADATVRLWDLRTCRQLARVEARDSVWALAADEGWNTLFYGCRDGTLLATSLRIGYVGDVQESGRDAGVSRLSPSRTAVLAKCPAAVTSIALDGPGQALWVSCASAGPRGVCRFTARQPPGPGAGAALSLETPLGCLPAAPGGGLRRAELCGDRRRAVVQEEGGDTWLWDLVAHRPTTHLGTFPDFEAARAAAAVHAPPAALPAWCTVDVRLGGVAVHLDPGSAFSVEAYAGDLGAPDAPDDQRLNVGHQALCCVLQRWAELAQQQRAGEGGGVAPAAVEAPTTSMFAWPQPPPTLLFQGPDGSRLRRDAAALTLEDGPLLPPWATEAVLYDPPASAEPPKLSFLLLPAPGPGALPPLPTNRLTAPRILKASKVRKYVASRLDLGGEAQLDGDAAAVAWPPVDASDQVQLTCDGKLLGGETTLAMAYAFLWKQGGEMTVEYSRVKAL